MWAIRIPLLLLLLITAVGCGRQVEPRFIMATTFTRLPRDSKGPQEEREAAARAENHARDEVLAQALQMQFSNGTTLGEAALKDPFIRAKVYDTVRGARVTDRTVTDEDIISVTVRLELEPIYKILEKYPPPEPAT